MVSSSALEVEDPAAGRLTEVTLESPDFGPTKLLVYSPPGYFLPAASQRYPVVYWLHGSGGTQLSLANALAALSAPGEDGAEKLDSLIESNVVTPRIMVGISAPPSGWTDALLPLVTEEIPSFVDRHFRTIARRGGRGLEGFSLGSEGVSRYVTARPDVFATAVLLGGGFLPNRWISGQVAILRDELEVAQFVGDQDGFQTDAEALATTLDSLMIPNELTILNGAGHSAPQIYAIGGIDILQFHGDTWRRSLVVDAGADQSLEATLPAEASLDGEIADPEGLLGSFTTTWQQVSGPGVAVFDDATALATTVTLPAAGSYYFRLLAEGDIDLADVVKVVALDTTAGLEVHLTFDAGTGDDSSGNARDGTLVGGPSPLVGGHVGGALVFDGLDDAVVVSDFTYGPAWSLSLWVKPADLVGTGYEYVASHNGFDLQPSWNLYLPEDAAPFAEDPLDMLTPPGVPETRAPGGVTGRARVAVRDSDDGPGQFSTAIAPIDDGGWHHLILTVPPGGGHRLYVDGVNLAGGSHGGAAFDPPGDLFFGTRSVTSSGRYFEGAIDDIRFYGRGLLDEEIARLAAAGDENASPVVSAGDDVSVYEAGGAVLEGTVADDGATTVAWSQQSGPGTAVFSDPAAPVTGASFDQTGVYTLRLTANDGVHTVFDEVDVTVRTEFVSGLLGHWPLDDGSGQMASDVSGLEQDGQLTGTGSRPLWVLGQNGNALRFVGANQQAVVIAASALLDFRPSSDDFSILLWLRVQPGAEGSILCRGATDASGRQYQLFLQDPNHDGISDLNGIVGGLTNDQPKRLGVRVDDGTWHHVALVHDATAGTNRIYIDGGQVGMPVASGTATSSVSVLVGARRVDLDDTGIGFPLTGDVDDVRFYARAVTPTELNQVIDATQCQSDSCQPFFADSFESGSASSWSSCSPAPCP